MRLGGSGASGATWGRWCLSVPHLRRNWEGVGSTAAPAPAKFLGQKGVGYMVVSAPARSRAVPVKGIQARNGPNVGRLRRRDVLGGLIHEYDYAA